MKNEAEYGRGKTRIFVGGWRPSNYDIAWAKEMVRVLKDGGLWKLPESDNVYKIDQKKKTFDLVQGEPDETFSKNFLCFGKIGYLVRDARGKNPVEPKMEGRMLIVPDGELPTTTNSIVIETEKDED